MNKRIAIVLAATSLGLTGTAIAGCGDDDDGETTTVTTEAPATSTTSQPTTTPTTSTTSTTSTTGSTTTGEDVSGNCDEAEHANDPECAAGGVEADDDSSGPGSGDD